MMQVEQAVFTSANTQRMRGYQLIAQSPGISDHVARQISLWCPSQSALQASDADFECLSFFRVTDESVAIARSIRGGPEYSARGELEIVTLLLVLRNDQLAGYDFHPLAVALTAMTLGHLRLRAEFPARLSRVELPHRAPLGIESRTVSPPGIERALDKAIQCLRQDRRVAVSGSANFIDSLEYLLRHMSSADRLGLSFTTGLKLSRSRPFRVQFLSAVDTATHRQLSAQGIAHVH